MWSYQEEKEHALDYEASNETEYEATVRATQYFAEPKQGQWLSTNFDTWVKNPSYQGAPQPHPEEYPACAQTYAPYIAQEKITEPNPWSCRCKVCDPKAAAEDAAEWAEFEKTEAGKFMEQWNSPF